MLEEFLANKAAELPMPVDHKTKWAYQLGKHTMFFDSFEKLKMVREFYQTWDWVNTKRRENGLKPIPRERFGPVTGRFDRDRMAGQKAVDEKAYAGSTSETREADSRRKPARVLTERIDTMDRVARDEEGAVMRGELEPETPEQHAMLATALE